MKHSGLALMAAAAVGLAACDSSETGPSGTTGQGKTAVFLTDAPFPFDRIARVDIHVTEIGLSPQADTSQGPPAWITVAEPDRTFNLLDLQNGTTALLGEADQKVTDAIDKLQQEVDDDEGALGRVVLAEANMSLPGTFRPGAWRAERERNRGVAPERIRSRVLSRDDVNKGVAEALLVEGAPLPALLPAKPRPKRKGGKAGDTGAATAASSGSIRSLMLYDWRTALPNGR